MGDISYVTVCRACLLKKTADAEGGFIHIQYNQKINDMNYL